MLRAVDTMKLVYQGVVMRLLWAGMLTHTAGDARVSPWGVPTRCGWLAPAGQRTSKPAGPVAIEERHGWAV